MSFARHVASLFFVFRPLVEAEVLHPFSFRIFSHFDTAVGNRSLVGPVGVHGASSLVRIPAVPSCVPVAD